MEDGLGAAGGHAVPHGGGVGHVDLEVDRRHVVPAREVGHEVPAQHPGRAGDEDPHPG